MAVYQVYRIAPFGSSYSSSGMQNRWEGACSR